MSLTKVTYSMISGAAVNVLDYGVVGDGITECSAATQAAVDAAPSGGVVVFPPGGTYKFTTTGTGYRVLVNKPLTIIAEGANFELTATGTPANWDQERHNAIFRVLQVDGFTWRGGYVDGNRNNATIPMVGFIVAHGCSNTRVENIDFYNVDHNNGCVYFDAVLPDLTTNATQLNISVVNCGFRRCYYGIGVRGSIYGLLCEGNWGFDFDLQNPQTGYPRLGVNQYGGQAIGVLGFGDAATSVTGPQTGVRIVNNYFNGMTQAPVCYNFASNNYTPSTVYECLDVVIANNVIRNTLTGIHVNGWEQAEVVGNTVQRASFNAAQMAVYGGVTRIATTAGMSGAGIEIATAGRKLSAVGNNVLSSWPLDGSTDYTGGFTGINFGSTGNTTDTSTTAIVSGNTISQCYFGLFGNGSVTAHVADNRVERCRRGFENQVSPLNGGNFPEGIFTNNTIKGEEYSGVQVGCVFRGAWRIDNNSFLGSPNNSFSYLVLMYPGNSSSTTFSTFKNNTMADAVQGLFLSLDSSYVYVENNTFSDMLNAIEFVKNATSTVVLNNNTFTAMSQAALTFSGGGSHGAYLASNNNLPSGGWVTDSAAPIPTQLGYATAAPGAGTFCVGAQYMFRAPTSGGFIGTVCTTAGAPGTWRNFGAVA